MRYYLMTCLILSTAITFSAENYFLCGPDEDGCSPDDYRYCICIPRNDIEAEQPFCLDFNTITCLPLSQIPQCPKTDVFKNQSDCVATAFQSEPDPPCGITSKAFCQEQHIPILDVSHQRTIVAHTARVSPRINPDISHRTARLGVPPTGNEKLPLTNSQQSLA